MAMTVEQRAIITHMLAAKLAEFEPAQRLAIAAGVLIELMRSMGFDKARAVAMLAAAWDA